MARVYASFVFAKMVTLKVFWDWAEKELIRKAMSIFFDVMRYSISSVSFSVTSGNPDPAVIIHDYFAFEPLRQHVQANHALVYHDIRREARML